MGDEVRRQLPVAPTQPIVQASELEPAFRIRMLDPQCQPPAALDHAGKPLALVEVDHARAGGILVDAQCHSTTLRFPVDVHLDIRREAHALVAHAEHAEVFRSHRKANAVVRVAADPMRARIQPVQADQAGPAVRAIEIDDAFRPPQVLLARERLGLGLCLRRQFLLCRSGRRLRAGRQGQDRCQQQGHEVQRPRRNHRSISARLKRVHVGRP